MFFFEDLVFGGLTSQYYVMPSDGSPSGVVGIRSFINAYVSSSEIWLLLGLPDFQYKLLRRIRLYVELCSPVATDDPSGSLLWLFLPCRMRTLVFSPDG
jgi:hypothetical protein